jgi:hypothetical protein
VNSVASRNIQKGSFTEIVMEYASEILSCAHNQQLSSESILDLSEFEVKITAHVKKNLDSIMTSNSLPSIKQLVNVCKWLPEYKEDRKFWSSIR